MDFVLHVIHTEWNETAEDWPDCHVDAETACVGGWAIFLFDNCVTPLVAHRAEDVLGEL